MWKGKSESSGMYYRPTLNLLTDASLYIDHGEASYIGCLLIEDIAFCRQVVELLLANRNRPIVEIGNLDVSHSL
jgi:hypothetical protein